MLSLYILAGAVSAITAWENRGHRTCVLDREKTQYLCVIGEHSVDTGNFYNVYIRLKAQKHGKRSFLLNLLEFCLGGVRAGSSPPPIKRL